MAMVTALAKAVAKAMAMATGASGLQAQSILFRNRFKPGGCHPPDPRTNKKISAPPRGGKKNQKIAQRLYILYTKRARDRKFDAGDWNNWDDKMKTKMMKKILDLKA